MTSIERTAYPRFKRLIAAHELHLFFSPTPFRLRGVFPACFRDSDFADTPEGAAAVGAVTRGIFDARVAQYPPGAR